GGIASAIGSARMGHSVILIESHRHLGGMSASGLGKSDIETREAIGGLFREFVGRVYRYYVAKDGAGSENVKLCRDGYFYEPSVAERIFNEMIAEHSSIKVSVNKHLEEVLRSGNRVTGIRVKDNTTREITEIRGKIFVDATYEGDLAAYAGARYRVGRESRSDFSELHAGVVYQDPRTRTFLAGTTGEGDRRLQAYTYRLCLTGDPANSFVMTTPPPDYRRERYAGYLEDLEAGRLKTGPPRTSTLPNTLLANYDNTALRALSIAPIPNRKTDCNMNPRPLSYPFPEENAGYADANWEERNKIDERIRNITLGLLWFLQNDSAISADQRAMANHFHLAKDEFQDNGYFPWQLYVREARRIVGLYTLSEKDVTVGPE